MDSFEITPGDYDLSALRKKDNNVLRNATDSQRPTIDYNMPDPLPEQTHTAPAEEIKPPRAPQTSPDGQEHHQKATPHNARTDDEQTGDTDTVDLDKHKTIVTFSRFFADGRLRIFLGVILILAAGYMLAASISYLSTGSADQSMIQNSTASEIATHPKDAENVTGWVGALLSHLLIYRWFGIGGFVIVFYVGALGISLVRLHRFKFWQLSFKSLITAIAISVIIGFVTYNTVSPQFWGGEHGYYFNEMLITNASVWGAGAVSILMIVALALIFASPLRKGFHHLRTVISNQKQMLSERYRSSMAAARAATARDRAKTDDTGVHTRPATTDRTATASTHDDRRNQPEPTIVKPTHSAIEPSATIVPTPQPGTSPYETPQPTTPPFVMPDLTEIETPVTSDEKEIPVTTNVEIQNVEIHTPEIEEAEDIDIDAYDPTAELSRFRFPSIDLLHIRENAYTLSEEEKEENNMRIISTLDSYGIKIESIKATVGPTITLYEIVPQKGTRIATIKHLGDDMAMSLSAIGIRIIAPIPGKGTIGMEVPNKNPQTVGIRTVLSSKAYHESTAALPMAMGLTISNEVFVCDLAKMPHLLVAGATGMGKSVGLNTIIASLLYKKHPAELKFVLVDPKMVEFSLYKCIERHYLAKLPDEENAIITDPTKVVATLNSLCLEMDNRYALLSQAGMRGIKEYNQKFISRRLNPEKGHRYLPYIVVIIDEFADLILTAGKEIETPISRIAAKARAVGIHMILATQRPSVNVITGTIKANFPGRMAFRVTQMNDSRTILDRPGAEQLIGRGDMLISRDGVIDRVQCAFIDTDEVEDICRFISDQIGYPTSYELPETPAAGGGDVRAVVGDRDPLFPDAGRAVIEANMGSASLLQRKFNIGYPRAGKIIDQLVNAGVLGASTGAGKPRPVLMDSYSFERMLE